MTLNQLAKEIQDLVTDGICNIVIYKQNKQWFFKDVWSWDDQKDVDEEKKIIEAKEIDPNAIVLNGYEQFGNTTLEYICWRVKLAYLKNLGEVV